MKEISHSKGLRPEMVRQMTKCLSNGLRPETVKERRRIRLSKGHRPEMVWLSPMIALEERHAKNEKPMNKEMKECGVSTEIMHCEWEVDTENHRGIPEG